MTPESFTASASAWANPVVSSVARAINAAVSGSCTTTSYAMETLPVACSILLPCPAVAPEASSAVRRRRPPVIVSSDTADRSTPSATATPVLNCVFAASDAKSARVPGTCASSSAFCSKLVISTVAPSIPLIIDALKASISCTAAGTAVLAATVCVTPHCWSRVEEPTNTTC
eukprot:COSAG06_NODE_569_length_14130_cov_5.966930_2_plen_172_part_00